MLFTRASVCEINIPTRKILDRYQRGQINQKRMNNYLEKEKKRQYEKDLHRTIVMKTQAYQEWAFETEEAKKNIYKKHLERVDECHPFIVDDYRMEVKKEMDRIDKFYKPLVARETMLLKEKRNRGLIHIEPEPFYLEGLDEVIPKIHEYLKSQDIEETEKIETEKERKQIE